MANDYKFYVRNGDNTAWVNILQDTNIVLNPDGASAGQYASNLLDEVLLEIAGKFPGSIPGGDYNGEAIHTTNTDDTTIVDGGSTDITGSYSTLGGMAVAKNLFVGGDFTAESTSFFEDDVSITGSTVITGDLTSVVNVTGVGTGNLSGFVDINGTGDVQGGTVTSDGLLTTDSLSVTTSVDSNLIPVGIVETIGEIGSEWIEIHGTNIYGTNLYGALTGDVSGDVTGDLTGNVTGDLTGNVTGNVTGDLTGNSVGIHTGDVTGDVTGNLTGNLTGNSAGIHTGDVTGDLTGNSSGIHTGAVTGDLTGDVTGAVIGTTVSASGGFTGDLTGDVTGAVVGTTVSASGGFTGDLVGGVIGSVTGNTSGVHTGAVIGPVTGDVTGDITSGLIKTDNLQGNLTSDISIGGHLIPSAGYDLGAVGDAWGDLHVTTITALTGNINGDLGVTGTLTAGTMASNNFTGIFTGAVIGAVTGDITGDLVAANTSFHSNTVIFEDVSGVVTMNSTVNSTASTDGSLVVAGGVGVAQDVFINGNLTVGGLIAGTLPGLDWLNVPSTISHDGLGVYTLGTVAKPWSAVHATTFYGNLDGTFTGDVTGDLTGNVLGDITGSQTGGFIDATTIDASGIATFGSNVLVGGNLTISGSFQTGLFQVDTLQVTGLTQSTTPFDGALTVDGGAGVAKNLNVGGDTVVVDITSTSSTTTTATTDDLNVNQLITLDGAVTITGDIIPTATNDIGATLTPWNAMYVDDITATTIAATGGFTGDLDGDLVKTIVNVTSTTTSSSPITGALVVAGGVGISDSLNVQDNASIDGLLTASSTSTIQLSVTGAIPSTDKDTGAVIIQDGGLGVEGNVNLGGNLGVVGTSTFTDASTFNGTTTMNDITTINAPVDINITTGTFDLLNTGGNIEVLTDSVLNLTGASTTLTSSSTDIDISSAGILNLDAVGVATLDASGITLTSTGVTDTVFNSGGLFDINATGAVTVDGPSLTVTSSGNNTFNGTVLVNDDLTIGADNTDTVTFMSKITGPIVPSGVSEDLGLTAEPWDIAYINKVETRGDVSTTDNATGDIVTLGGIAIQDNLWVDGTSTIGGQTNMTGGVTSTSVSTGDLVVAGGVGVTENLWVGGTTTSADIDVSQSLRTDSISTFTNGANLTLSGAGAGHVMIIDNLQITDTWLEVDEVKAYNATTDLVLSGGVTSGDVRVLTGWNLLVDDNLIVTGDISTTGGTIGGLTAVELTQLNNIDATTISTTQWGYLGLTDQGLATTDAVTFGSLVATGNISTTSGTIGGLTAAELTQLQSINATTIDSSQWGWVGAMNQSVATTDSPTFVNVSASITGNIEGDVTGSLIGDTVEADTITANLGFVGDLTKGTQVEVTNTTTANAIGEGALWISGGVTGTGGAGFSVNGNVYTGGNIVVGNDAIITGDLTVNGTTTTINTQDMLVEDKNVILGNVATPSTITGNGGGITLLTSVGGIDDQTITWHNDASGWNFSDTVTSTLFSGSGASLTSIPNGALDNSSVTVGTTDIALGASSTTLSGLTSVSSTGFTGDLTGNVTGDLTGNVTGDLTGNVTGDLTGNVSGAVTGNVTGDLTGNVTGDLTGNADTATSLATSRTIGGVSFDGTADITVASATGGFAVTGDITVTGDILPDVDVVSDLGSAVKRWSELYASTIYSHRIDGTSYGSNNEYFASTTHSFAVGGISQIGIFDGFIASSPTVTTDLGSTTTSQKFKDGYFTGTVDATTFTGDLTGNVTGDLTGNVTGDLTGNVIGTVTGAENWVIVEGTAVATTADDFTALSNTKYMIDSSLRTGGFITMTLPTLTTEVGTTIWVTDMKAQFDVGGNKNVITNSITFEGATDTFEFDVNNGTTILVWTGVSYGWKSIILRP